MNADGWIGQPIEAYRRLADGALVLGLAHRWVVVTATGRVVVDGAGVPVWFPTADAARHAVDTEGAMPSTTDPLPPQEG